MRFCIDFQFIFEIPHSNRHKIKMIKQKITEFDFPNEMFKAIFE